ncbi:TetR/AcrR family transcriptional regulator [Micromonospora sp. DR5-3]|uniref:TetR/AcrR family transcriptional regulator n=1 Tax=unclassified Micromonospora TaxID=2617518 RepID=UPI0011DA5676|nr:MULTISPECIES: TetR/AcrR family transcriptional regulator [unclassified Micromonospora]MCW3819300.1 TetR/AcrR family transcriptional regulator [Micromonospora sp. DR5-3]TYC19129.1 TetR/AcrR family transcriptional regulator [Micromonospora sp. MP36]
MTDVKSVKNRSERAAETRRRILDAALDLFVANGYGATKLQEVADRAGVAIQTIYFVFGNKRKLLKDLVDATIAGDDEPIATMDRPWFRAAMAAETADALLHAHVRGAGAVLRRVSAITDMVATAIASDAAVAQLWPDGEQPRLTVHTAVAEALIAKPGARDGITAETAADLLFVLLSTEMYLLFVRERGWPSERWEQWTYETLRAQLCAP